MRAAIGAWLTIVATAPGVASAMDVVLEVKESAGVARVAEPCTNGVPLVPGAVRDEAKLRLTDHAGRDVPAQFRVINRRPVGDDVEWVNVAFLADVPAHGTATYHLTDGGLGRPVADPVKVEDGVEAITIDNGPLKLVVPKKAFAGLGEVWLNTAAGPQLASSGGALVIEGMDGRVYRSVGDLTAPLRVSLEEQGPLHVVVRIDGEMQAQSADGKTHAYPRSRFDEAAGKLVPREAATFPNQDRSLGFTARIHVWQGRTVVRTLLTMRSLDGKPCSQTDGSVRYGDYVASMAAQEPGNVLVDAVNFDLALAPSGPLNYRIGGGIEGSETHAGTLAGDAGVTLYQDSSASWYWQAATGKVFDPLLRANVEWMAANNQGDRKNQPYYEFVPFYIQKLTVREGYSFMGYRLYESPPAAAAPGAETSFVQLGEAAAEGMRAPGWIEVDDGRTAVTAGCRWFWQMCPKSLELRSPGQLTLGLWSRHFPRGHLFEGIGHRTHEMVFDFRPTGTGLAAQDRFAAFGDALIAWPGQRHHLASRVWGDFPLHPLEGWPRYEQSALSAVQSWADKTANPGKASSFEIEREKHDLYGVWNFGDSNKGEYEHFGQYLELDVPYCLLIHFARTGDMRFYREAEIACRELLDVPAHGGGHGHQPGEPSHYYCYGPMLFACAAGEPFLKDAVRAGHCEGFARAGQSCAERRAAEEKPDSIPGPHRGSAYHRSLGVSLWSQTTMYRHFPAARAVYHKGIDAALACADHDPPTAETLDFWMGISCDGLAMYCDEFPRDQQRRARLVEVVRLWMDRNKSLPADKRVGIAGGWQVGIPLANAFAYATRFSGDDAFLDYAGEVFANDQVFSPCFRNGAASAKGWSEWGHRLCQVYLHDWDKRRHPEKYEGLP